MIIKENKDYDELFNRQLGAIIKEIREQRKWTTTQVADKLGIQYPRYYSYESGIRSCPMSILKKICMFLKVNMEDVLIAAIRRTDSNNPRLLAAIREDGDDEKIQQMLEEWKKIENK